MSDILAVMPTYLRSVEDLVITVQTIRSFKATCDADLFVIDDGSPYTKGVGTLVTLSEKENYQFCGKAENEGFARTVNHGLRRAREKGQHALLVNADMEFMHNDWLDHMRANEGDVVGALLLYTNGLVQHAGVYYSVIMRWFDHMYRLAPRSLAQVHEPRNCPVTGALQLIKHPTLEKIGLYDENFRMGLEDVDYCQMTFQAGMTCSYEPKAEAIHYESVFRRRDVSQKILEWSQESWDYLHSKHAGKSFADYIPTMLEWQ